MRRDELLAEFRLIYAAHMGIPGATMDALLSKLVIEVPDGAFDDCAELYQRNTVWLLGEVTTESANACIDDLMDLHLNRPTDKDVTLVISSGGGDIEAGLAIIRTINQMRRDGRKVNGHVAGWAFSSAFDILQHCDYRTAETSSFLMLHEEQVGVEGSTTKRHNDAEFSRKSERAIFEIVSRRTGKPVKFYVDKARRGEWYLSAEESVAERFIDEIVGIPAFPSPPAEVAPTPRRRRSTSAAVTENS